MFYDFQSESRRPCLKKASLARGDLAGAVVEQQYLLKEQIQLCVLFHISEDSPGHFKNPAALDFLKKTTTRSKRSKIWPCSYPPWSHESFI